MPSAIDSLNKIIQNHTQIQGNKDSNDYITNNIKDINADVVTVLTTPDCNTQACITAKQIRDSKLLGETLQNTLQEKNAKLPVINNTNFNYSESRANKESILMQNYKAEAELYKQKQLEQKSKLSSQIMSLINNITNQDITTSRMKELYELLKSNNTKYKNKIDKYYATVETSDRKTFYQSQYNNTLDIWKIVIIVLYWIMFLIYLVVVMIMKKSYYKNYEAWILLIIFALTPNLLLPGLSYLIQKIFNLFQYDRNSITI
jgi:hypothetical protein